MRIWLTNTIHDTNYEKLINDLCMFRLQRELKSILDKIYPLKGCQIRKAKIETRTKVTILKPTAIKEEKSEKKPAKKIRKTEEKKVKEAPKKELPKKPEESKA